MTRTDDDSWDLASSVGATATMVAAQRALASHVPNALINDPYAEPLVRAVGIEYFTKLASGDFDPEQMAGLVQLGFTADGMANGMASRTWYYDTAFEAATAAGVRQVVILASGLDTRAYRLNWPAGTTVYELDQPDVIAFKTDTLAGLGASPSADRRTVAIDLRDDWPTALKAAGFDPGQPTVWSAEGLLIYLPAEAQDRLFASVTELSAPGSRLVCEQVPGLETADFSKVRELTRQFAGDTLDLDMESLVYAEERQMAADWLSEHGWSVVTEENDALYARLNLEPPNPLLRTIFPNIVYVDATLG
ncbi:class I SAM-dependent methyltransferase [Mycobacteroides salmoniphilum]|uniref:class I SAM-dependent methyltransferase n=1 Tax=Mycobacteroides salmoniphilum TaxID=404941 RepID=UPI0009944095|nr:class I SAM-dependent methyltransferase [Mycobacteroides salmoniphilum]QCH25308.1 Putative S-adenosyl-L-methionine-dependent methyltransferase [Mycobacteroides salmoniphilum]